MTDKHREFTLFISFILLTLPVLTYQYYLVKETGELTQLKSIDEIKNTKPTMYYSINNSFQHKNKSGLYIARASVDRGNEIGVGCYFACPLTNTADTISNPTIWIGTMFGAKFSDRLFDNKDKQEKLISKFIDSSIKRYDKYEYKTTFLKRLSNSEERDDYLNAILQTTLPLNNESLIILREETRNYQSRAGTSFWWTIFFIITSNVVWALLTGFAKIKHVRKKNAL